ncbi:MAG: hypothetical protein FWE84_00415, partial [Firmicutes bacterium]|nr:hypothetical protein [Bacillota bacterium]
MAKKPKVVDNQGREVKVDGRGVPVKSFKAIKSLIAFAIVVAVLVGIIVGGVYFAGNWAVKEITGGAYTYSELRTALKNVGDYRKAEKQLDNKFETADADDFTGAL